MKNFLGIITTSILFVLMAVNLYAIDCSTPLSGTPCSINSNMTGLVSTPNEFAPDTTDNCCLLQCISNAELNSTQCICSANYYKTQNTCTACSSGYSSSAGSTAQSDCKKTCSPITVTNGTSQPVSSTASEPDNCKYNITCNNGYHSNDDAQIHNNFEGTSYTCVANTYTIIFNTNDGTAQSSKTGCTYGQICSWSNTTTKTGYTLTGWAESSGGTTSIATTSMLATFTSPTPPSHNGNITLYAIWADCTNTGSEYASTWNGCTITKCKSGYYLSGSGTDTSCIACDSGFYCDGTTTKTPCPAGYYCPGGGTTAPNGCNKADSDSIYTGRCKCPGGHTSDEGQNAITACFIKGSNSDDCIASANCTNFCDVYDNCFYLLTARIYYSQP